jgi:hypothetical protein
LTPWHVSAIVFALSSFGAFYLLAPRQVVLGDPSIAQLGVWAFALGAGQLFLLLLLLALLHRGPGVMYCAKGFPGITTWSAAMVSVVSILLIAFAGLSLGASFVARPGQGREDLVAVTLWALGGWLATVVFVPLRRKLKKRLRAKVR